MTRAIALAFLAIALPLPFGGAACPPDEPVVVTTGWSSEAPPPVTYPHFDHASGATDATSRWMLAYQDARADRADAITQWAGARDRYLLSSRDLADDRLTLSFVLAPDDRIERVLVDDVVLEGDCVRLEADQLEIIDVAGNPLVHLTLNGTIQSLVSLAQPAPAKPPVRIGITMEDVSESLAKQLRVDPAGAVMIASVVEASPAQRAGLAMYDVVTHVDGVEGVTQDSLREVIQSKEPGGAVTLHVIREGRLHEVQVEVEADVESGEAATAWLMYAGSAPEAANRWIAGDLLLQREAYLESLAAPPILNDVPLLGRVLATQRMADTVEGVLLEVRPRVLDSQIILETVLAGADGASLHGGIAVAPGVRDRLEHEIAQLEAQVERLRALLAEMPTTADSPR
jgi:hypothetical protein